MTMPQSKKDLRLNFQQLRNNLSAAEQDSAAESAAKIFMANIKTDSHSIISAYYPTNNELSPIPLLKHFAAENIVTSLPVIKDNGLPLDFHRWREGDELHTSPHFKLQEPRSKSVIPNIIIVPMLAFDSTCHRLGYGGGYYDRTLNNLRELGYKFTSVGYAYSFQKTDFIPYEETDIRLDCIVTDKNFITNSASIK